MTVLSRSSTVGTLISNKWIDKNSGEDRKQFRLRVKKILTLEDMKAMESVLDMKFDLSVSDNTKAFGADGGVDSNFGNDFPELDSQIRYDEVGSFNTASITGKRYEQSDSAEIMHSNTNQVQKKVWVKKSTTQESESPNDVFDDQSSSSIKPRLEDLQQYNINAYKNSSALKTSPAPATETPAKSTFTEPSMPTTWDVVNDQAFETNEEWFETN